MIEKISRFDGLTGEMWKHIFLVIPDYLENIMAQCICEGYFPTEWKIAIVVVLLKSPDKVRCDPKPYRGICTTDKPSAGEVCWKAL